MKISKMVENLEAENEFLKTYAIWQWGRKLFEGSFAECRKVKKRWTEQHGNIELKIYKV